MPNLKNSALLIVSVTAIAAVALSPKTKSLVEAAADSTSPSMSEQWTVASVADGDTITVKRGNETKKIRFCGIDAPEKAQAMGKESKEKLRSLVALAKNQVIIIPVETDRYGRTVAEVMASVSGDWGIEMSFQEEMLKSGMARIYPAFVDKCPNKEAFKQAEKIGKSKRLGVWGDLSSIPPWEFRKQQRQNKGN
ncbi:thermonuclease family protein [Nostoc sp. FACHB-87]|uniref:thermonuclease family protein n=1 Tax=Nostocaceae TaxID=1162 RepID=UPI0016872001|nr:MULTISPECIES: thermonuclease family protein [Nostocaceae]MBD2458408.1 thermonuclease family protein [Nostoc sp. FACHB-87]MBD2479496.1 thermonuclease family protein [Anabaena sp. FACHB-83]